MLPAYIIRFLVLTLGLGILGFATVVVLHSLLSGVHSKSCHSTQADWLRQGVTLTCMARDRAESSGGAGGSGGS